MPELAEVETVVRGLRPLEGRRIVSVWLGKIDFIFEPQRLAALLPGKRLVSANRRGKLLLLELQPETPAETSGEALWLLIHLGMTGQLVLRDPAHPLAPHTHVRFALDDGRELRYVDIRRFGRMRVATAEELSAIIAPLGADPLEVSEEEFRRRLSASRARLKSVLLDQTVLRGLGNIYADESLWRAQLHPLRRGAELSGEELRRLWRSIREVAREAIRLRGTSVSDYVDANGQPGSYQKRLRVYRRAGRPCRRCGAPIARIVVAGRGSHFCPQCQPARRARLNRRRTAKHKKRLGS
jgi:formamidopyrimidine-DNA glycosylase